MISLKERIDLAKKTTKPTNCIGTALFLVGELDKDSLVNPGRIKKLNGLKRLVKPEKGCLIAWELRKRVAMHLGVIVRVRPIRVTHREGSFYHDNKHKNYPVTEKDSKTNLDRDYNMLTVGYYRPRNKVVV